MRRYLYCYQTVVSFSAPVRNHAVLVRCLPRNDGHQTVDEEHLVAPPGFRLRRTTDAFGNRLVYGGQREPHTAWAYVSSGIVSTADYAIKDTADNTLLYLQPSRLAFLPEASLSSLSSEQHITLSGNTADRALQVCHHVHDLLEYAPSTTSMETTAADVLTRRKGVCQDFAHLMTAFCRHEGMAARYACGFLEGTGETHAWVEVFDGYAWLAFDPTHDRLVDYGYVKLAHGRDAADCPVSRGTYVGQTYEQTEVRATLKEI